MLHPQGLVATIYPKYFYNTFFGSLIDCFTFMRGFDDDTFMKFLDVKALRPEDLGWTKLETKEEWVSVVTDYFKPQLTPDLPYIPSSILLPSVTVLCFPMIQGATDYHWAIYNGTYWLEQAGHGGAINVWVSLDGLIEAVYKRGEGKYYVEGSHFFFSKNIA